MPELPIEQQRFQRTPLPEEGQLKGIDDQIARLQRLSGELGRARSNENVIDLLGIGPSGAGFSREEIGGILGFLPPPGRGPQNEFLRLSPTAEVRQAGIHGISQRIRDLLGQKGRLTESIIGQREETAKKRESQLRSRVGELKGEVTSAIDRQLAQLLEETGINAGQARQGVGAVQAERGLLRSSQTVQDIGQVGLQEQQQKAQFRSEAETKTAAVTELERKTFSEIEKRRERLQNQRDFASLQSFEDLVFNIDVERFQQDVNLELQNIQMEANDRQFLHQVIATGLGGIGKIFAGGF